MAWRRCDRCGRSTRSLFAVGEGGPRCSECGGKLVAERRAPGHDRRRRTEPPGVELRTGDRREAPPPAPA